MPPTEPNDWTLHFDGFLGLVTNVYLFRGIDNTKIKLDREEKTILKRFYKDFKKKKKQEFLAHRKR